MLPLTSANCELRRKWKEWLGGVKRCSLLPFLYTLHFTGFFIEESLRTVIFLLFYYFINIRHKDYFISKKRGRVVVNLYSTGHNVFFMWLRHIYMAVQNDPIHVQQAVLNIKAISDKKEESSLKMAYSCQVLLPQERCFFQWRAQFYNFGNIYIENIFSLQPPTFLPRI